MVGINNEAYDFPRLTMGKANGFTVHFRDPDNFSSAIFQIVVRNATDHPCINNFLTVRCGGQPQNGAQCINPQPTKICDRTFKTVEQKALLSLHRARDLLVRQATERV
ncbi:MAG: hypothetical protein ABJ327_00660 [Litoreibacter sp.]